MTAEEKQRFLDRAIEQLGEHFDHVQIMVTWNEAGSSHRDYSGCGNWYARQGMAHEFINMDLAQENARAISERLNPPG